MSEAAAAEKKGVAWGQVLLVVAVAVTVFGLALTPAGKRAVKYLAGRGKAHSPDADEPQTITRKENEQ